MRTKSHLFTEELTDLAEKAKALSHPARLEILRVLAARDTCICGEVVDELPLAQATVSRHLKTLKDAGLIRGSIEGPRMCYCLDTDALRQLETAFDELFDSLNLPTHATCC